MTDAKRKLYAEVTERLEVQSGRDLYRLGSSDRAALKRWARTSMPRVVYLTQRDQATLNTLRRYGL